MKRNWILGLVPVVSLSAAHAEEVIWKPVGQPKALSANQSTAAASVTRMASFQQPMPNLPSAAPPITAAPAKPSGESDPLPQPTVIPTFPMPSSTVPQITNSPLPSATVTFAPSADVISGECQACDEASNIFCCDSGCTRGRVFGSVELLGWVLSRATFPPLLTTSSDPVPAGPNLVGAIGQPGTTILLGNGDLNDRFRWGMRFRAGAWIDACGTHGFDASYFFTARETSVYEATTPPNARLFRPFEALNTGIPLFPGNGPGGGGGGPGNFREQITSLASNVLGGFRAKNESQLWGADANYRRCLRNGCTWRLDGLAGGRFMSFDEGLSLTEYLTLSTPSEFTDANGVTTELPANTPIIVRDRFYTKNRFYGGQIGVNFETCRNRWTVSLRPTIALGVTNQQLKIDGLQAAYPTTGSPLVANGGLLALDSNIGHYSASHFSVIPEVSLNVGYQVSSHFRVFAGYNFLYWSNIIRPGDQIDTGLDVNRIPNFMQADPINEVRPTVRFDQTDFWAQGVNLGAEFRW